MRKLTNYHVCQSVILVQGAGTTSQRLFVCEFRSVLFIPKIWTRLSLNLFQHLQKLTFVEYFYAQFFSLVVFGAGFACGDQEVRVFGN